MSQERQWTEPVSLGSVNRDYDQGFADGCSESKRLNEHLVEAFTQGRAAGLEEERALFEAWAHEFGFRDSERVPVHNYAENCARSAWLARAALSPTSFDAGKDDARDAVLEEAIRDAIAENMTGLYYCCRTWSAWQVGTMSQNDFWPAGDDDEIIQNITDGVMAALSSLEVIGKGEKG